jgi:branched-chain amino acid transport system permease protein
MKITRERLIVYGGVLFFALLPPVASFFGEHYLISLFTRVMIYALAAVSLDLLLGYGKMISLGHAAFVGIGAYVVGITFFHAADDSLLFGFIGGSENALVVWPAAVFVSAMGALVIGALSLRTSGMHFIMITLAFAQMLFYFAVGLETYGGDDGLPMWNRNRLAGLDLADNLHFYYVCFFLMSVFIFCCTRLVRSRFGLVLRGASTNTRRIRALGVHDVSYKLICFVIAGAGAGLAGALLANQSEFVSPGLLHWGLSGELMVMVLLGGLGTLFGPVLGAVLFLLLEEFLAIYTEHWMVYFGPVLIIVVLTTKRGIYGLLVGGGGNRGG